MAYVVGQEVGYGRFGRYGLQNGKIGIISKVNGHGHVFVDDKVFDKHGHERGTEMYWGDELISADQVRAEIAAEKIRRSRISTTNEILRLIADRKCGNGNYAEFNDELKQLLCAKIQSL